MRLRRSAEADEVVKLRGVLLPFVAMFEAVRMFENVCISPFLRPKCATAYNTEPSRMSKNKRLLYSAQSKGATYVTRVCTWSQNQASMSIGPRRLAAGQI